jgi:type IV conjugative transfer system protein TraE
MTPENITKNSHSLERALSREKSLRFVLLAMLTLMTIAFISKSSDTKIVLVPFGSTSEAVSINEDGASQEYLKQTTKKLIHLGYSYSPLTAHENFEELLTLVDPEHYGTLHKVILKKEEEIKRSNISSAFFPGEYIYDVTNQRVAVKGVLKTYSGEKLVSNSKKTILFEYKIVSQNIRLVAYSDVSELRNPFNAKTKEK